jgi:DNA polymerase-3 subunit beta
MVATDSYRLSVKETKLESPLQGSFEANVPARALQELTRIVQTTEAESLSVSVRTNQVIFEACGVVLSLTRGTSIVSNRSLSAQAKMHTPV